MIQHLLFSPYAVFWLPAALAVIAGASLYLVFRPVAVPDAAPAGDPTAEPGPEAAPKSPEQRRSFRRSGNPIGILYALPEKKDEPMQGSLVDRSMGGLCLLTHEAFPAGTVLVVRPTTAEQIVPWVEIEVCACRPADNSFEVGCRFVKTPPYSILLLFG
jgi:hypothetical protein